MQKTELAKNISVLSKAHPIRHVDPENGLVSYPNESSLFEQLRTEIGSSSRRGGKSGSGSRSPVALAAVSLWSEIQESLNTAHILISGTDAPKKSAEEKLELWADAAKDEDTMFRCTTTTNEWIQQIRELLNPVPSIEIIGACPSCGERYAFTEQDGETLRNAALTATVHGAKCGACGAEWEPGQFEHLKHQI